MGPRTEPTCTSASTQSTYLWTRSLHGGFTHHLPGFGISSLLDLLIGGICPVSTELLGAEHGMPGLHYSLRPAAVWPPTIATCR